MRVKFEIPVFATVGDYTVVTTEALATFIADAMLDDKELLVDSLGFDFDVVQDKNRLFVIASGDPQKIVAAFDGQMSDGWGECFEQQPIKANFVSRLRGDLYVSLWGYGWREAHPYEVVE